jgi:pyruvate dehydrogenase E2 component (dihydrolipoamide acetyltransferase)
MPTEIYMPKMSDHMQTGIITGWLVVEGEHVAAGQPVLEVETDKTIAEIESPKAGFIKGIRRGADKGSAVPVGEVIAFVVASADDPVPDLPALGAEPEVLSEPEPAATSETSLVQPTPPAGPIRTTPFVRKRAADLGIDLAQVHGSGPDGRITEADLEASIPAQATHRAVAAEADVSESAPRATPFVRKRARELGIDLAQVTGSGPHGRISEDNLNAFLQAQSARLSTPAAAPSAPAPAGEEDSFKWLELTKIQRVTGERMTESARTVPQFSLTVEVDATNLLELRELLVRRGVGKISVTAILVKMVADVLRRMRRANASFVDDRLKLHEHVNIGVAVGSEDGLLVPVIHDADQQSLVAIDAQLVAFREKASRRRFAADDLMGGTFTISNLGMFGIRQFSAIVNPPESGILAVGEIVYKPICLADRSVAVRPTMMLTLTVDHRSMDGPVAAELLGAIKEGVEQPLTLVQDQLVGKR